MRTPILYLLLGAIPAFIGLSMAFGATLSLSTAGMGTGEVALIASGFALAATVFLLGCGFIAIGRDDMRDSRPARWS